MTTNDEDDDEQRKSYLWRRPHFECKAPGENYDSYLLNVIHIYMQG